MRGSGARLTPSPADVGRALVEVAHWSDAKFSLSPESYLDIYSRANDFTIFLERYTSANRLHTFTFNENIQDVSNY